jgi:hypothetical protein
MASLIAAVVIAAVVLVALPPASGLGGSGGSPSSPNGEASPVPTPIPVSLSDTTQNIHIGLAFDSQVTDFNSLRGKIDIVWGASKAESVPGAFIISYNPSERIGNAAVGPLYSFSWFKQNHPDWIVYRCDRTTPAYGFGEPNTPLDITNPAVLQFIMDQEIIPQIKAGYDGIGFDNVGFDNMWERCGHFDRQGNWVPIYTGLQQDPIYQQSILTWGREMYTMIKQYDPKIKVALNFSYDSKHQTFWEQMLPYVDILVDEAGYTNFGDPGYPYLTDSYWTTYSAFLQHYQAADSTRGVFLFDESPTSTVTPDQMEWALANYLLVKGQHTYVTVVGQQQYGQFYDQPAYHIAIGSPLGIYAQKGCVYQRSYTGGLALVNPSSQNSCSVKLSRAYKTLAGTTVSSVDLGPHSGAVLLTLA